MLVLTGGIAIWVPRRHPGGWITPMARTLALVILLGWAGEYVADAVLGTWSLRYTLPLQLTDAVSVVSILALCSRRMIFVELAYFWSLTASLQALLTPDLAMSFPSVYYFTYFTYHIGVVVAACFLVLGCRLYPSSGAVLRVYAATLAWTVVAAIGDLATGGNYMYLSQKPAHNSLLSVMGPWPWYIASTAALGLGLLLIVNVLTGLVRDRDAAAGRVSTVSSPPAPFPGAV